MSMKNRTEIARKIILSPNKGIIDICVSTKINNLANDILRVSFDYCNFNVAQKTLKGGGCLQTLLLKSPNATQMIGSKIYQMYKYGTNIDNKTDIIEFFLSNVVGNKDQLKNAIENEARLHNDPSVAEYFINMPVYNKKRTISLQDTNPPIALGADKVALMTLANSCLTYNSRSSTPCISSFPTTRNRFHNDSINRKSDRSQ